jgi:hypothetical protein
VLFRSPRVNTPFPAIFSRIDKETQKLTQSVKLREMGESFPDAEIAACDMFVKSKEIVFEELGVAIQLSGRLDVLARYLDGSGYIVIDYKTTMASPEIVEKYFMQLHSYAFGAEYPAEGDAFKIKSLGIAVTQPGAAVFSENKNKMLLEFDFSYFDVGIQKKMFMSEIKKAAELISSKEIVPHAEDCSFANYAKSFGDLMKFQG